MSLSLNLTLALTPTLSLRSGIQNGISGSDLPFITLTLAVALFLTVPEHPLILPLPLPEHPRAMGRTVVTGSFVSMMPFWRNISVTVRVRVRVQVRVSRARLRVGRTHMQGGYMLR